MKFKLLDLASKDIGIDLGTANIIITLKGKGIVINEPSVVAIQKNSGELVATGLEAKEMLGRTPEEIKAIRPLRDGVIADYTATQVMLKNALNRVCKKYSIFRPRVVVGVPSGITEVEERAVEEAVLGAGAREVYLIEEPMAAAIGANLSVSEPEGNMVVDIGGGTTEVAVVSLGGTVVSESIRVAGDELDEAIMRYMKNKRNLIIGQTTAEQVKISLGCALPLMTVATTEVRGRDSKTGYPKSIEVTSEEIEFALQGSIQKIVEAIKQTLEKTPPELAADIMENGIVLTGGGAMIQNLDKYIMLKTQMPVYIAEEPLNCVAKGATMTLDNLEKLKPVFLNSKKAVRRKLGEEYV